MPFHNVLPDNSTSNSNCTKEVFILGSGFNSEIIDENGRRVPRSKTFFPEFFKSNNFYGEKLKLANLDLFFEPILKEIKRNWHKSFEDLKEELSSIDLEECITYFERNANSLSRGEMRYSPVLLKILICNFLNEFARVPLIQNANAMKKVGTYIWKRKIPIITFNYDLLTELALEYVSGSQWQRKTGYSINFAGEVTPDIFNINQIKFDNNTNPILKLHGSVNWFKFPQLEELILNSRGIKPFSAVPSNANLSTLSRKLFYTEREDYLTLSNMIPNQFQSSFFDYISPQIITPVLYKSKYYGLSLFKTLWKKASEILMQCNKIVIIGYSFPQTDEKIRALLANVIRLGTLKEIEVVNIDEGVSRLLRNLYPSINVTWKGSLEIYAESLN